MHDIIEGELKSDFWERPGARRRLDDALAVIGRGESSPYREAQKLLEHYRAKGSTE